VQELILHTHCRVLHRSSDAPIVDAGIHELQMHTTDERVSVLKARSMGAANTAQAAAAQANTQLMKAEDTYVKTMAVGPELTAIKKQASSSSESAAEASKEGQEALKRMEESAKTTEEKAKEMAVMEVKALLKEKYHQLSDWRHKVLGDPWRKGQVAAAKAADPYFKSMGSFSGSINAYTLEAGTMRSQAAKDLQNADAIAVGAKAKRDAGDVVAAAQDEQMATALHTQSQQLTARAATLDAQAADMRNVMPQYAHAAQMAAWTAEYSANPDGVPPPPVNPNTAFASPEKLPK